MKIACVNCGANVVFVPSLKKCHCNHCGKDIVAFFVFAILGISGEFFFREKKLKYDYRNPTHQHISKKVCKKYFLKKYDGLFGKESLLKPKANWECSKEEFAEYEERLRKLRKEKS